jgi:hypothetical protein
MTFTNWKILKSLQQLALQSDVSVSSVWTATKLLRIRLCKITVVPEIKPMDYIKKSEVL